MDIDQIKLQNRLLKLLLVTVSAFFAFYVAVQTGNFPKTKEVHAQESGIKDSRVAWSQYFTKNAELLHGTKAVRVKVPNGWLFCVDGGLTFVPDSTHAFTLTENKKK